MILLLLCPASQMHKMHQRLDCEHAQSVFSLKICRVLRHSQGVFGTEKAFMPSFLVACSLRLVTSFGRETNGSVAKCWLFSQPKATSAFQRLNVALYLNLCV